VRFIFAAIAGNRLNNSKRCRRKRALACFLFGQSPPTALKFCNDAMTLITLQVETLARETIEKFEMPGIAVLAAQGGANVEALSIGADAAGAPVGKESLFIVASLTKLATALCVLRLADAGAFALDDALETYVPDAAGARDGVTLRALLCHTAGLPQDLPNGEELYGRPLAWQEIARECLRVELERAPRSRVVYGNVGYGLLAIAVERVTRENFAVVLQKWVLKPLDIEGYLGDEPPRAPMNIADVRSRHAGTDIEPYNSRYYRSLALPWSQLVTTTAGALKLVRAFAGVPHGFLSDALRHDAISNQTDDLPGGYGGRFDYEKCAWGLGADIKGDKKPHWTPPNASAQTFGHAGASGCVVWHDPAANVSWGIFGTRTADNAWLVRAAPKIGAAILEVS
jgi:beta-lactamase class C